MIKDYRLIKRVFFSHDDRQLLKLQHRDTVRASTTDSDGNEVEADDKLKATSIAIQDELLDHENWPIGARDQHTE